jgi:3-deoxy-D-manno-octulosonic-acid transferase
MSLARGLYTLAMYLAMPIILYRLAFRGLRYRGYFSRWMERFGWFRPLPGDQRTLWVHAVSVGEFNAAVPLIEALMHSHPDRPMVVTTITPTGSERVRQRFGERVFHVYLPYDLPAAVRRFLDRIRPRILIVLETEIWPNLYHECGRRGIPIVIANGRLSERSLRGYAPARSLITEALRSTAAIAAQTKADAERFLKLGSLPERTRVVGNVKFDLLVPEGLEALAAEWRARWGALRPVWIAASTHEGEEAAVLQAHARVLGRFPDALLILVPRHPERFRSAIALCRSYGFRTHCRSEDELAASDTQCFVVDSMGELLRFYACCDVAFVGGSLDRIGGHNVLEPAALGKPVLIGPHTFNFAEISEMMLAERAAVRVEDGAALGHAAVRILSDPARARDMGLAALRVVASQRGAVPRTIAEIEAVLQKYA